MGNLTIPISGMKCASCAGRVEKQLAELPGVITASVNLATSTATLIGGPPLPHIVAAIAALGFNVPVVEHLFLLQGLASPDDMQRSEAALAAVVGVFRAQVDLAAGQTTIHAVPGTLVLTDLQQAVRAMGYDLYPLGDELGADDQMAVEHQREQREWFWRLVIGGILALAAMIVDHRLGSGHDHGGGLDRTGNYWVQFLLITPVQFWVGWPFHRSGWAALRHGSANMNTLVMVGTFAAYGYSLLVLLAPGFFTGPGMVPEVYFDSAGMILVIILLGRLLEARAKGRTSQAIQRLIGLQPRTARVIRLGQEVELPLAQVIPNDRVVVRPGERTPVDGVIEEGASDLDESMITGESMPVARGVGDPVVGGSINRTGFFVMRAVKMGQETLLARIVAMVRQAQGAKPPIARLADQIANRFVPAVIGIAVATFLAWWLLGPDPALNHALMNAVAVLIIACPCALGLATPTSVMVGMGKGAEHGILIRGGEALETAHRIQRVIFDKTGTLTKGKPILTDWHGESLDLALVAGAESRSEHPIAQAVLAGARARGLTWSEPTAFQSVTGMGVRATVAGQEILVGSRRLLEKEGILVTQAWLALLDEWEAQGKTALLAAKDGQMMGALAVADAIRPESREVVDALRKMGIQVAMITGDNWRTAMAIAQQLSIQEVRAQVLPEDKAMAVAEFQAAGEVVAMVGDGINDAPALARADVGIAIGTGTDIAMEAADITLMSGDPSGVVTAIRLSRATMRNIRQNLFWAFAYNVILIPLAAGVWFPWFGVLLSPVVAAVAMGLSSVTVVSNALRLRYVDLDTKGSGGVTPPAG